MKRRIIALTVVFGILTSFCMTAEAAEYEVCEEMPIYPLEPETLYTFQSVECEMYSSAELNVRDQPAADGNIVGGLSAGQKVHVYARCSETGWYHIQYGDLQYAYVCGEYLLSADPRLQTDIPDSPDLCRIWGNVDPSWKEAVDQELSVLSSDILETFTEAGWTLYVTDMDIDREIFDGAFGAVMGCTLYDDRRIFIENRETAVEESTVHEFGHFIDDYLGGDGFLSDSREYLDIYEEELDGFMRGFYTTCYMDPKELIAEGLFRYFLDPRRLEACAPRLAEFLKNCVESFS